MNEIMVAFGKGVVDPHSKPLKATFDIFDDSPDPKPSPESKIEYLFGVVKFEPLNKWG